MCSETDDGRGTEGPPLETPGRVVEGVEWSCYCGGVRTPQITLGKYFWTGVRRPRCRECGQPVYYIGNHTYFPRELENVCPFCDESAVKDKEKAVVRDCCSNRLWHLDCLLCYLKVVATVDDRPRRTESDSTDSGVQ